MDYNDNNGDQRSQDNGGVPRSINQLGVVPSQPPNNNNVLTSIEDCKSPLGLKLTLDERFLNLMTKIFEAKYNPITNAVTFSALSLQIGNWKKTSMTDSDLKCKIYPRRNQLSWEIMIDGEKRKNKIQVEFEDIDEMNVAIPPHDSKGSLILKMKGRPSFFVEKPPKPKQHTDWDKIELDFTDNQASSLCSHIVEVKSSVLEKHISTILTADPTNKPIEGNRNDAIQPFNVSMDDYLEEPIPPPQGITNYIDCNGTNQNDAGWQFDPSQPPLIDSMMEDPILQGGVNAPNLIDGNSQQRLSSNDNYYSSMVHEASSSGAGRPLSSNDEPSSSGVGRPSSSNNNYYYSLGIVHEASSSGDGRIGHPYNNNNNNNNASNFYY